MGAVITNTELIVFDLVKISGTPEFKEILKLVKKNIDLKEKHIKK
jgi:D-ribose pyranose/furanose isomerase RbsD